MRGPLVGCTDGGLNVGERDRNDFLIKLINYLN